MKVLFINKFFFLNGGSERVFFQERELLGRKGIGIMDFSMKDPRNMDSPYSDYFIEHVDYRSNGGFGRTLQSAVAFIHSAEAVRKLERLLERERPDIAHLHNIYHQLTPSIIPVLKKYGVKVAMTLHDYKLICPSYLALSHGRICTDCGGRSFWKTALSHCQGSRAQEFLFMCEALWHLWQRSYESVDVFLAPSQFLADLTARRVPREKIQLLRNGININEYQPNYADKGYILYFGRLSREKGIDTLLKAHSRLRDLIPLRVVGAGPLAESLRKTYPGIQFLGYKSGAELNDLIRGASFVVVPSECYENCSMTVLEAMAHGKAVVGSHIGGIPEQIEAEKSGFLFQPCNTDELELKMARMVHDKDLRRDMGIAGREIVENKFSLSEHGEKLVGVYTKLLEH